jgi:hypothetical protein
MTIEYMPFIRAHIKDDKRILSIERTELHELMPSLYAGIVSYSAEHGDRSAETQEFAIKALITTLPIGSRVQFSYNFKEVSIFDERGPKVVSGRGITPEGALYFAFIKYLRAIGVAELYRRKERKVVTSEDSNNV